MTRGMVFMTYTADNGDLFQTYVNADDAADATRGWGAAIPGGLLLPRGLRERYALGVSATTGRTGRTRVGSAAADLWTGAADTFDIEGNDGVSDVLTVIERRGERRRLSH